MEEPKSKNSESRANNGNADSPTVETGEQTKVADSEKATPKAPKEATESQAQSWEIWEPIKRGWETIQKPESTNLIMAIATVVIAVFTAL